MKRRLRTPRKAVVAAAALTLAAAPLSACGEPPTTVMQPEGPTIAIGVAADEPGLSRWHDGTYSGFETDVARYVAGRLGYADKQIIFKQVQPSNRFDLLGDGTVDMVVAGMPMPENGADAGVVSDGQATYAGPYLTVTRNVLVRTDDAAASDTTDALDGAAVCAVSGSGAGDALLDAQRRVVIRERDTYPQCLTDLMVGTADAVAGDSVVLAGLAREAGDGYAMPARARYGSVRYGIAVAPGAVALAAAVEDALKDMRDDGSYDKAMDALPADAGWHAVR